MLERMMKVEWYQIICIKAFWIFKDQMLTKEWQTQKMFYCNQTLKQAIASYLWRRRDAVKSKASSLPV
jgi:hypothetical protein